MENKKDELIRLLDEAYIANDIAKKKLLSVKDLAEKYKNNGLLDSEDFRELLVHLIKKKNIYGY